MLSLFAIFCLRFVGNDFYYDELLTLKKAVFVPLGSVVFSYSSLNTHIFSAVINNVLMAPFTFEEILITPYLIRIPQLVFPLLTLWSLYLIGTKIHSIWVGVLAAAILATTLPFYYYSASIRGYELSLMLFTAMFLCHFRKLYIPLSIFTALFLYVMPSNFAFVAGFGVATIRNRKSLMALGAGTAFAGIAYLPVLSGMLNDTQLRAHDSHVRNLTESIPEAVNAFVSYRWLLIPVALYGFIRRCHSFLLFAGIVTLIPLALFVLSGGYLWARVLFPLFPIWSLALAIGITNALKIKEVR